MIFRQHRLLALFCMIAAAQLFACGYAANNTQYSVAVATNASQYSGIKQVLVTGTISPTPAPYSLVNFSLISPQEAIIYTFQAQTLVNGSFRAAFSTGTSPKWMNGTYVLTATYIDVSSNTTFGWDGTATANTTFPKYAITGPTTAKGAYNGTETIAIRGSVTPVSGIEASSTVVVSVAAPGGSPTDVYTVPVTSAGLFNISFAGDNNPKWVNGTYTVTARYYNVTSNTTFEWKQVPQQTNIINNTIVVPSSTAQSSSLLKYVGAVAIIVVGIAIVVFLRRRFSRTTSYA